MYKKSSTGWLKHLDFMVLDIICLQLAFVMGYFLRHHSFKPYGSPIYRNEAIVFALIQLMIMFFDDSFKNVMKRGYLVEIGMTVKNMPINSYFKFSNLLSRLFSFVTMDAVPVMVFIKGSSLP